MNARIGQLFDEARLLAPEERSLLAIALLDSVEGGDGVNEAAVEQSWIAEARRRSEALHNGVDKAISWEEVKARLLAF